MAKVEFRKLGSSGGFIENTYTNLVVLRAAGLLIKGAHYKITDRADLGIILLATDINQFSLEGEGVFLNPNFQGSGNYTGVPTITGLAANNVFGVWYAAAEGVSLASGDIVFRDGLHYQVEFDDPGLELDGSGPGSDNNYTLLPKTASNVGYIEETDFILYDFVNDTILIRKDIRGNSISDYIKWQWGNNNVINNTTFSGTGSNIRNQRGTITSNVISNSGYLSAIEDFTGTFNFNKIIQGTVEIKDIVEVSGCTFNKGNSTFTIQDSVSHTSKVLIGNQSTFEISLDMTNGVDYDLAVTTLDISSIFNYIGVFTLINNPGQTISKITGLPPELRVRFVAGANSNQIFSHTAKATAANYDLISDVATANTITSGNNDDNDFIEYELTGKFNRRYNAVIIA